MNRRTGTLLVYAGSVGLATTFLLCVYLQEALRALRGWHCDYEACTIPAAWSLEQTRDMLVLWFGGLRSVMQIRAGLWLQQPGFVRRGPVNAYLAIAAIDCVLLALLPLPDWTFALAASWPLFVYALTRSVAVEPLQLPRARLL